MTQVKRLFKNQQCKKARISHNKAKLNLVMRQKELIMINNSSTVI